MGSINKPDSYRPDIDGLRALSVGIVVLQHCGLGVSGGFVGVDVFFVISGFLITRLILEEQQAGTFTLKDFWIRRMRRIIPAAAVAVGATLVAGVWLLPSRDLHLLAESAVAQQLMLANMYFWSEGGYFDLPAYRKPLLHTWSLAVEEQFYLFYPVLLMFLRRLSRRMLGAVLFVIAAISLLYSVAAVDADPTMAFYLMPMGTWVFWADPTLAFYFMPMRMWELLAGALLAVPPKLGTIASLRNVAAGSAGLLSILAAAFAYTPKTPFPAASAVPPCLGAALIIACPSTRRLSVTSLLSLAPVVYIGRSSYSIYLWHWPLLTLARAWSGTELWWLTRVGIALCSIAIGIVSFEFIETPIRSRKWFSGKTQMVGFSAATASMLCASSLLMWWVFVPGYDPFLVPVAPQDSSVGIAWHVPAETRVVGDVSGEDPGPEFVVWGDSHTKALFELCDELAQTRGICGVCCGTGGFVPLVGAWITHTAIANPKLQGRWNNEVARWIRKHKIRHVILAARWDSKFPSADAPSSYDGLMRDAKTKEVTIADSRRVMLDGLHKTLAALEDTDVRVYFLMQVPVQGETTFAATSGPEARGVTKREYQRQQAHAEAVLRSISSPRLTILGPSEAWFDADGYSLKSDGKDPYYRDKDHVSRRGAQVLIRPLLEPVFDAIASDSHLRRHDGQIEPGVR